MAQLLHNRHIVQLIEPVCCTGIASLWPVLEMLADSTHTKLTAAHGIESVYGKNCSTSLI